MQNYVKYEKQSIPSSAINSLENTNTFYRSLYNTNSDLRSWVPPSNSYEYKYNSHSIERYSTNYQKNVGQNFPIAHIVSNRDILIKAFKALKTYTILSKVFFLRKFTFHSMAIS